MAFQENNRVLLDPTDIAIIEAMQENGRIAISELGRRVGLSQPKQHRNGSSGWKTAASLSVTPPVSTPPLWELE